ncbi:helix-turn-helix transcriptional regulator [Actimicrobium sp. CCC2.4]|uniref:helix-turn-helix domain-containing protein n=1 Tax=Actimicrobium sp. CCC2.4 TaxID=3048606 RepID=UPI002AC8B723|nr:helix-turn-helix transcriptional regulator [Actimicrobium sp. CCC2.4]MEB0136936.1 helix-turn-helix transcriptional regulator [Actimicrobium sp. CCC2.4]WPX32710.1 helix-turn-helix transcriptional regulator [Actimicrobium sp. CCC2.4]
MLDLALALPHEICLELGARARTRRLSLNVSVDEMAQRIGLSNKTLGNFERTGRCTLETFVRILESLNATADLQSVLVTQNRTIEDMRAKEALVGRQRAYRLSGRTK